MLDIYKASAGSGKTYTLALIYIDLIIDDFSKYSNILAVTFTNKSTAEMKSRIVKNLYTISNPAAKGHLSLLNAQKNYRAEHNKQFVNDIEIISSCRNALVLLLNNYSQFNISTIDRFVQKIIRSFAFENKLSADYSVNIDTNQTKTEMVDMLMSNIETDPDLRRWLTRLMNERMEDGQGWNIEGLLSPIALSLLEGHELQAVDRIALEKSRKNNRLKLEELLTPIANGLDEFVNEAKRLNLDKSEYFFYGTKNSSYKLLNLIYYSKKTTLSLLKDKSQFGSVIDLIYKAPYYGNKEKILKTGDDSSLKDIIFRLIDICDQNVKTVNTINLLDSKFYSLGIINDLKQNLSEIERNQHMQMIGGTNKLLKDLIGNAPIPFIYEKAGSKFDNIMIDEFQDTSKVQWDNFKPLIENSLANNKSCLLVGDVKQAIYRWRNSDWRLLSETVYSEDEICDYIKDNTLGTNWRSFKNVIEFNNDIFPVIAKNCIPYVMPRLDDDAESKRMLDIIAKIYAEGRQEIPLEKKESNTPGYVQLNIMNDSTEAVEIKKQQLVDTIKTVVERGYRYSDICIIIRNNKEATDLVQLLNNHNINVLSNQALYVCESQSIKALISLLKLIVDDTNEPALAHVLAMLSSTSIEMLYDTWNSNKKSEIEHLISNLRGLGVLELVYKAIDLIPEESRQRDYIFLEAFVEKTRDFVDGHVASLKEFIDYIEGHASDLVIQAPEGQNAVNITTIHKSKGLEYPIVLIPNAHWNIYHRNSEIWCDVDNDPLTPLNTIELPFSSIKNTNYSSQYYNEATQSIVDNMNLLYVVFTRAKEGLFVWCNNTETKKEKALSSITICDLIKQAMDRETEISYTLQNKGKDIVNNISVKLETKEKKAKWESEVNGETQEIEYTYLQYEKGEIDNLRSYIEKEEKKEDEQANLPLVTFGGNITKRIHILDVNNEDDDENNRTNRSERGTAMHNIMQRVITSSDIDKSIRQAVVDGEIQENEAQKIRIWFENGIKDSIISSWFDGSNRVINESVLLTPNTDGKEYRTDRVMINKKGEVTVVDYKFGQETPKHFKQVQNYMNLVRAAGHNIVKGYLWYESKSSPTPVEP